MWSTLVCGRVLSIHLFRCVRTQGLLDAKRTALVQVGLLLAQAQANVITVCRSIVKS